MVSRTRSVEALPAATHLITLPSGVRLLGCHPYGPAPTDDSEMPPGMDSSAAIAQSEQPVLAPLSRPGQGLEASDASGTRP